MDSLLPIDRDPFATPPAATPTDGLLPIEHDPFAAGPVVSPIDRINTAAAKLGLLPGMSMEDKARAIQAATRPAQMQIEGAANAQDSPIASPAAAFAGSAVNALPVVGAPLDEGMKRAAAWAASNLDGTSYEDALNRIRGASQTAVEQHPVLATAGRFTGPALAVGMLAGTPAAAAFGLEGSLPTRILQGTLGGTTIGAADAATRGESPWGGAAVGAASGLVSPIVGDLAGTAAQKAWNVLAPSVTGPLQGLNSAARAMLAKAGLADETAASMARGQQRVGPAGFAGDVTGGLNDLTGGIANMTGPGKQIVRQAYEARDTNPPFSPTGPATTGPASRIEQAVTTAFGPRVDLATMTRGAEAARSAAADPLYQAWQSTAVPMTPGLAQVLDRVNKFYPQAIASARRLAGAEGQPIISNGDVTAQGWDYIKQGLDDFISGAQRNGSDNEVRIATGLKRQLIDEIDNHPDPNVAGVWQQARQAWADPTSMMKAREAGQSLLTSSQRPDELRYTFAGMSAPERQAFTEGARDNIQSIMDATTRGDTTARNTLLAPTSLQKLQAVIGPDKTAELANTLEQEAALKVQNQRVVGGSQTTPKAAQVAMVTPPTDEGFLGWWNRWVADKGATYLPKLGQEYRNDLYTQGRQQLAPILTAPGSAQDQALIDALMRFGQRNAAGAATASNTRDVITALMAGPASEEGRRMVAPYNMQSPFGFLH